MNVTIKRRTTIGAHLAEIRAAYGPKAALRRHLKLHPNDFLAKVALHDVEEYRDQDPDEAIDQTHTIVIPDQELDQLTMQRIGLLLALKGMGGSAPSVRALSRTVERDIKNVSEDVRLLGEFGLVEVEEAGRGRARRVSLAGDEMWLGLVEG